MLVSKKIFYCFSKVFTFLRVIPIILLSGCFSFQYIDSFKDFDNPLINITEIDSASLPKLGGRNVGYVTFKNNFCKIVKNGEKFYFYDFLGNELWPNCEGHSISQSFWQKSDPPILGSLAISNANDCWDENIIYEDGNVRFHITHEEASILQAKYNKENNFSFNSFSFEFDFNKTKIYVEEVDETLVFFDAKSHKALARSVKYQGWICSMGVIERDGESFLVLIKSFRSYHNFAKIWIFDKSFNHIFSKEISGREWYLVPSQDSKDTLHAYRIGRESEVVEGLSITIEETKEKRD